MKCGVDKELVNAPYDANDYLREFNIEATGPLLGIAGGNRRREDGWRMPWGVFGLPTARQVVGDPLPPRLTSTLPGDTPA